MGGDFVLMIDPVDHCRSTCPHR